MSRLLLFDQKNCLANRRFKSLSLTLLVQFFKDYCRQQILIKTDLTSMTFQSLYQANLNGLKQQLYSSILAVCIVTFPCGIHESSVTIVDFGLCSAVWQHWTQKTLLKLSPPFFVQNSIRQVSSTLAHRNYVFFCSRKWFSKIALYSCAKKFNCRGRPVHEFASYAKNASLSSRGMVNKLALRVTQPYFTRLVLSKTVCGRYWQRQTREARLSITISSQPQWTKQQH